MSPVTRNLPLLLCCALFAVGCVSSPREFSTQLDEQTGVTVARADRPIVFYRNVSARAAHARDFLHLGPIEINRMGSLRYYLWLGAWSTAPLEDPAAMRDGFEMVTLFADGEPLQLAIAGWTPGAIGASRDVYTKPVATSADAYYEVTIDQIRLIAEARDLRLTTSGPVQAEYVLWQSQRSGFTSLAAFVGRISL
jgi:hypothetical protein